MGSCLCLALLALGPAALAREPPPIGGVYEMGIGTRDPIAGILYWQQFGYSVGREGSLSAGEAGRLYGVACGLRSIRLHHQDADHGLIRLMVWEKPRNEGLGLAPMKVKGSRWGAMLTADVLDVLNHAEDAKAAGWPVYFVEPQKAFIYAPAARPRPFLDPAPYVREMCLIQPESRQILFQRFAYSLPLYGRINENAPFRTSQITHFGLVTTGGPESLDFYDGVLGLLRVRDGGEGSYEIPSARAIFALAPGERYLTTDFDDPRSSKDDPRKMRSGRLKICRFPEAELADRMDRSRPGCLGVSLYTIRVRGIEAFHERVAKGGGRGVTEVMTNEFGERSFGFVAPDGYAWVLVE